jgi:hypothetical protein
MLGPVPGDVVLVAVGADDFAESDERLHLVRVEADLLLHRKRAVDVVVRQQVEEVRFVAREAPEKAVQQRPPRRIPMTRDLRREP